MEEVPIKSKLNREWMTLSRYKIDKYQTKQIANRTPISFIKYESMTLSNGNCRGLSVNYEKNLACAYFDNNEILVFAYGSGLTGSCSITH